MKQTLVLILFASLLLFGCVYTNPPSTSNESAQGNYSTPSVQAESDYLTLSIDGTTYTFNTSEAEILPEFEFTLDEGNLSRPCFGPNLPAYAYEKPCFVINYFDHSPSSAEFTTRTYSTAELVDATGKGLTVDLYLPPAGNTTTYRASSYSVPARGDFSLTITNWPAIGGKITGTFTGTLVKMRFERSVVLPNGTVTSPGREYPTNETVQISGEFAVTRPNYTQYPIGI